MSGDVGLRDIAEPRRSWIRRARRAGWTVKTTANSHVKLTSPTGRVVVLGAPSRRGLPQHDARDRMRLRRAGLDI